MNVEYAVINYGISAFHRKNNKYTMYLLYNLQISLIFVYINHKPQFIMNLTDVEKELETLNGIPKEQKKSILKLIDIKTESNMEKVLERLDKIESNLETKIKVTYWLFGFLTLLITVLKIFS